MNSLRPAIRILTRAAMALAFTGFVAACSHPTRPAPDTLGEVATPGASSGWIRFKPAADVDARTLFSRYAASLQLAPGTEMRPVSEDKDDIGITHLRYQQYYRGVEVEGGEFIVHARDLRALSANGDLALNFAPAVVAPAIDEAHAWAAVQERMHANKYYDGEHLVDELTAGASNHVPRGTLVFATVPPQQDRVLAWRFDAYVQPLGDSRRLFVDAATGRIVKEAVLVPNCFTTNAPTTFRGNQSFNTARVNVPGLGDRFVLMDDCHGNELHELAFNFTSGSSREVFDSDNVWTDQDRGLVTSFWALGVAYDFYDLVLGRKSYDNHNGNMLIVNDPTLGNNANGGAGAINIGVAAPGPNDDYNTTDIVGHEFTHSVIEKTAKLSYVVTQESAALNESYSDIFGEMTEAWEESTPTPDWVIGADKGCVAPAICRNLINPKAFSQPDTYQGLFWQAGAGIDPHNNGTVQNRWFALLAAGGSGTNVETSVPYNVTGIGIKEAQRIAYRTLTYYLTSTSAYTDARDGSIQAAKDLFGEGSSQEGAVIASWCAVNLCPFTIPTLADRFDRPGGNPNPASPNNNNTVGGATPIAASDWTAARYPQLSIPDLNIFPVGDVDNFRITLPETNLLGGRCFPSGVSFKLSNPADVRIIADGRTLQFLHDTTFVKLGGTAGTFVLQVSAPFPNMIMDYAITATFYQSIDPLCWQTEPPTVFEQIHNCPMCNVGVLTGIDEIILDPDYRSATLVSPSEHYFNFGGGDLDIEVGVRRGNGLLVELVDSNGRVVRQSSWAPGTPGTSVRAAGLPAGIYALRFSGFGNGTEVQVRQIGR